MAEKIGIFGGTFDPIHQGHLILAERCRDVVNLDRVIFVPTFQSPLKEHKSTISDQNRIDLLKLAISGNRHFDISTYEIDQNERNYTVDTLRHFRKVLPDAHLYFLLGSDSLGSFSHWKAPQDICDVAELLVINRPGFPEPDYEPLAAILSEQQIRTIKKNTLQSPLIEISSSEIRRRIQNSESIRYLVPPACEKKIQHQKLYQS